MPLSLGQYHSPMIQGKVSDKGLGFSEQETANPRHRKHNNA